MKIHITFLITFFFILGTVTAVQVKIDILEIADGRIIAPTSMNISGILRIDPEFVNTGSTAYKARTKLDILRDNDIIFTGWSDEKEIFPGDRKTFSIYWYLPNAHEELSGKLNIHYANTIKEYDIIPLNINTPPISDNPFQIYDFRTYDNYIRFDVNSIRDSHDVIIFISDIPVGWIFEQKRLTAIKENRDIEIVIPYSASIFNSRPITITIVSDDGRFYAEEEFILEKEEGLLFHFNHFIDSLKNFFRSIRDAF